MPPQDLDPRVIVALDFPTEKATLDFVDSLDPRLCRLKVGFELFVACGPRPVETLVNRGFDVFLDLKFHDIPNTVAAACRAACGLGVWMLNLHAQGGRGMLEAAKEAVARTANPPLLVAVTVLTSLVDGDLAALGIARDARAQAQRLAGLAQAAGLDGAVCSAQDAARLRTAFGKDFLLVTPGIRWADAGADDQKRIMTPANAIRAGSDFLVIGRPVTRAEDPAGVLEQIDADIRALIQE